MDTKENMASLSLLCLSRAHWSEGGMAEQREKKRGHWHTVKFAFQIRYLIEWFLSQKKWCDKSRRSGNHLVSVYVPHHRQIIQVQR